MCGSSWTSISIIGSSIASVSIAGYYEIVFAFLAVFESSDVIEGG